MDTARCFPSLWGSGNCSIRELWALTAREAAREAAADGLAMTFAPMLDVARDPRWGRSAEGPGEDPWLGARIAEAKVRGFQGADLAAADALAAVAKHFCAYGAVTAGRDYASVDISERTLHEVYLPPFAAAVAAGVAAVMPAFTDLAGIPMTANARAAQGLAARAAGIRRRHRERLQRHRRAHSPWRCGRSCAGGDARTQSGRGHRHDGRGLPPRLAGCAGARLGDARGYRRLRAPGAEAEAAARPVR